MTKYVTPEDAIHTLKRHLHDAAWFRGASLVGVGPGAEIVVRFDGASLQDVAMSFDEMDWRWEGYPVRIRRAS